MKKIEKQKQQLLMHLSIVPIASGKQLECFFTDYQHPEKRLSSCLRELEQDGLVEGKARPIGESKIWRLSKKGREWMDIKKTPVPLSERKVDHFLSIGSVYFYLQFSPSLRFFEVEPRFSFYSSQNEERVYCPDAFFVWEEEVYFLEVQRSPLSSKSWKEKWKVAEQFYQDVVPFDYQGWNIHEHTPIMVLSEQTHSVISQTSLPLKIESCIETLFPILENSDPGHGRIQILEELEKDIDLSRSIYSNWNNEKGKRTIPPLSIEALHKYEKFFSLSKK